ncbi:MAG: V-type ATP synthase subunit I [archaeon]|nr:V-type ATP synthase subunit I [archaeon]
MFVTVDMSRLTVAAPVDKMEQILRICSDMGCVHIEEYGNFEDGIGVGQAIDSTDANSVSTLLTKVRGANAHYSPDNIKGPKSVSEIQKMINSGFEEIVDHGLAFADAVRDAEAEIDSKGDQLAVLRRIEPLNIPLDLLTSTGRLEVYVSESAKSKTLYNTIIQEMGKDVEVHAESNVIAIACLSKHATDVQLILNSQSARAIQVPSGVGSPSEVISSLTKDIDKLMITVKENSALGGAWVATHGRDLVIMEEYLTREDAIFTAPTLCAVSKQAFAIDAWVPTENASEVKSALSSFASHVEVEEHVDDHHHAEDEGHHHSSPPIALDNGVISEPFEMLVDLVGRPKYGTFDPTVMMMMTFPLIYGMILGDWGYGLIILMLAKWLGSKPFAVDPIAKSGITILTWMGAWCIIWGIIFAEGFGFIWDGSAGASGPTIGIIAEFYTWTYNTFHVPETVGILTGLTGLHMPFHRAVDGYGLQEYLLLSIYIGVLHLFSGFIIGLVNVYKAHGFAAAYFEKGSWILILIGGFMQCRNMVSGYNELFEFQIWTALLLIGIVSLIIGLAIFEKFGWIGGLIMGPIETFGLLANTLSYLRIMAVGVAGVKIAELSITMGWDLMWSGDIISFIIGLILFTFIQIFALALGLLSPSIHAIRLHFVEWMGKFYDGSGVIFNPLGGRTLHAERESQSTGQ